MLFPVIPQDLSIILPKPVLRMEKKCKKNGVRILYSATQGKAKEDCMPNINNFISPLKQMTLSHLSVFPLVCLVFLTDMSVKVTEGEKNSEVYAQSLYCHIRLYPDNNSWWLGMWSSSHVTVACSVTTRIWKMVRSEIGNRHSEAAPVE